MKKSQYHQTQVKKKNMCKIIMLERVKKHLRDSILLSDNIYSLMNVDFNEASKEELDIFGKTNKAARGKTSKLSLLFFPQQVLWIQFTKNIPVLLLMHPRMTRQNCKKEQARPAKNS